MAKGNGGCLSGILIGCAVLLVIALGAGAFGYFKVVRPVQERVARFSEIEEESEALGQRLDELNAMHPWEAPADPSEVVLEPEDVERYVAVRSAVDEALTAVVAAAPRDAELDRGGAEAGAGGEAESAGEAGAGGQAGSGEVGAGAEAGTSEGPDTAEAEGVGGIAGIRDMFSTMFGSFEEAFARRLELQRAAVEALEAQEMSPRELRSLLHLVEWRFLGRSEAAFFDLPPRERSLVLDQIAELREARRTLALAERFGAEVDGRSADELRGQIERLRTQISVLQERASPDGALHPRTRAVLEERRDDLARFGGEGVDLLATLTDQEIEVPAKEGASDEP